MKQTINKTDIAIITTEPVDRSFNNEASFLHAVVKLVKDDEANQIKTYKVRTDLVKYAEDTQELTWLEQKQDWNLQTFSYAQIDEFAEILAPSIPDGLTRTQRDAAELQLMFLKKRQQDAPWGIDGDKWKLRNDSDLTREKV